MKLVGYFKEQFSGSDGKYGSIYDIINGFNGSSDLKSKIIKYLHSGVMVSVTPMIVRDILDDSKLIGEFSTLTDGVYQWPSDYAYYIERYNLQVPETLITHMKKNNWEIDRNFDPESLFKED